MVAFSTESGAVEPLAAPVDYSILIVTREIGDSLSSKLESITRLEGLGCIRDVLIGLDGASRADPQASPASRLTEIESLLPIQYIECPGHIGKNAVINKMLPFAKGSVLLFTDVDSMIKDDALTVLNRWFQNPEIGAVAGLRVIVDSGKFGTAQGAYVGFDTQVKNLEMRFMGSVTSCDGKLYAIRTTLADSIPLHVTDDTYIGLGAPLKNRRLIFDAELVAKIGRPAKNPGHEFDRRRRVTTRGLHSLVERRALFRFTRYGWYSYCLFANKVCRRFAPASLALVLLITAFAAGTPSGLLALLSLLLLIMASFIFLNQGVLHSGTRQSSTTRSLPVKLIGAGAYFILGMSAMALGTFDFLRGKKVSKWEPRKSS